MSLPRDRLNEKMHMGAAHPPYAPYMVTHQGLEP